MKTLILCFVSAAAAFAQQPEDPVAQLLFPPELVMNHQRQLGLTEAQRTQIRREIQAAQSRFLDYQWQMSDASEKMIAMLKANPVDEKKTLAQADEVMNLEREIKRTHLGLLIRLRNLLTADQTAKLEQIRARLNEPGKAPQ